MNSPKVDQLTEIEQSVLLGKKLLLVEDNTRNAFTLAQLLGEYGLLITIAKDGERALKELDDNNSFDILVTDIMMPNIDGIELIKTVRAGLVFHKMPIIALTAKAMVEDREQCLLAGANTYLAKPVEIKELLNAIHTLLVV